MTSILFGTCFAGTGERYRRVARPFLERVAAAGDRVAASAGDGRGICAVYNDFIAQARREAHSALVLVHDDVEIHDEDFRGKVLEALADPSVGVVGPIGGRRIPSLSWWHGEGVGGVYETRGPIFHPERAGPVDALDGLLLALGPRVFDTMTFDAESFPRFHGYDVDLCLRVGRAGLRCEVIPLQVLHRTDVGAGDAEAFAAADRRLREKHADLLAVPAPAGEESTEGVAACADTRRLPSWLTAQRRRARRLLGSCRRSLWRGRGPRRPVSSGQKPPSTARPTVCLACGAALEVEREPAERAQLVSCPDCDTSLTSPVPTPDPRSDRIWRVQYGGKRERKRPQWLAEARLRIGWLKASLPAGRLEDTAILDVGAAAGEFVEAAAELGLDVRGVEPSPWAARIAQQRGLDVHEGDLGSWAQRQSEPVDVVTMWHVLEHLPDPDAVLGDVRGVLRPGGYLALEVPNGTSSEARALGADWPHAQPDEHVTHFSPDGLRSLLHRCGFEVVLIEELSEREYSSEERWLQRTNAALLAGVPWPSLDLIRVLAASGDPEDGR